MSVFLRTPQWPLRFALPFSVNGSIWRMGCGFFYIFIWLAKSSEINIFKDVNDPKAIFFSLSLSYTETYTHFVGKIRIKDFLPWSFCAEVGKKHLRIQKADFIKSSGWWIQPTSVSRNETATAGWRPVQRERPLKKVTEEWVSRTESLLWILFVS